MIRHRILILMLIAAAVCLVSAGFGAADEVNVTLEGHFGGATYATAVSGNYAYVGQGQDLVVLDISNPSQPLELGRIRTGDIVLDIYISGNYAYVAEGYNGLEIIDVSNPAAPALTGSYNTAGYAEGVAVSGSYAYFADSTKGLVIIDISNPIAPALAGSYDTAGTARGVAVSGSYAYVADYTNRLVIVDISNTAAPTLAGIYDTAGYAEGVAVSGSYGYIADGSNGLEIIDISNPAAPALTGSYDTAGYAEGVAVSGSYAYVVDRYNGLVIIDISNPAAPALAGSYDTAGYAEGVAVSGSYAYVADRYNGLVIIDISNPAAPALAGSYNTAGLAVAVAVSGSYAYVADFENGLVIVDIGNPAAPALTGSYDTGEYAVAVAVSGSYAYVVDRYNGLVIIDISNPVAPAFAGSYDTAGFARGVAVSGSYAYVADDYNGLVIIDINNPAAPTLAGSYNTAGHAYGVAVSGNYAYVADYLNDLVIVDISNPAAPVLVGSYYTAGYYTYGVAVSGSYAYVAKGSSGLKIIDLSNPAAPAFAGSYDTAGNAFGVAVSGNYAYVAASSLVVVDISNPAASALAGSYNTAGNVKDVAVSGSYAYVADAGNGLVILCTGAPSTDTTPPTLTITSPTNGSIVTTPIITVTGTATDDTVVASVTVNGIPATGTTTWSANITLTEGSNTIAVVATDNAGNVGEATIEIVFDKTPPTVTINAVSSPTNVSPQTITGTIAEYGSGIKSITINGEPAVLNGNTYSAEVLLTEGSNTITVVATDNAGNAGEATTEIVFLSNLKITSASSDKLIYSNNESVHLTSIIQNEGGSPISADGVRAEIQKPDGIIESIQLNEGITGNFSGNFENTSLIGTYNVSFSAEKAGYISGSAGIIFEVSKQNLTISYNNISTWLGANKTFAIKFKNIGATDIDIDKIDTNVSWINAVSTMPSLSKNEEKDISFTMEVPNEMVSGQNFFALRITTSTGAIFEEQFDVFVYDEPVSFLEIKVIDNQTRSPIPNAMVMISNDSTIYYTDSSGIVDQIISSPGSKTIYSFSTNYLPNYTLTTLEPGLNTVELTLSKGQLLVTNVTSKRLNETEIIEAGVDLSDTENYWVYNFTVNLKVRLFNLTESDVRISRVVITPNGSYPGESWPIDPIVLDTEIGGGVGSKEIIIQPIRITPPGITGDAYAFIVIPGQIKFLKEFFSVSVIVTNDALSVFSVENTTANLMLPEGLTLVKLKGDDGLYHDQEISRPLGTITGGSQNSTQWIVRGDAEGNYTLNVNINSTLTPFGISVNSIGTGNVRVYGKPNLELIFMPPKYVREGVPLIFSIGVKNLAPIPVYGVTTELFNKAFENVTLDDEPLKNIGTLDQGETKYVSYNMTPKISGYISFDHSYVISDLNIQANLVFSALPYLGDFSGDGTTDSWDITYLARSLVLIPGYDTQSNGDVSGDGVTDVWDCTYLARAIAGVPGYSV